MKAGQLSELRAFANKAAEHMVRIAGALTVLEDPDAQEISGATAQRARNLMEFYLSEAHRPE